MHKSGANKQRPNVMPSARVLFQIPALVFAIIGFILIFSALATPAWQVVYARELRQWVQSGLWLSCQTRPTGMYTCTYTFSKNDFDFYTSAEVVNIRTPPFYQWQRTLLHIFLFAQFTTFLALISFCVSNMQTAQKCSIIMYNVCMAISTLVTLCSAVAFAVLSHMVEYRFYHVSVSGIYEKHRGYSYYLALTGSLFYLCSLILSIVFTIKTYTADRYGYAGSSQQTINAYRPNDFRGTQDDFFAMRALPEIPNKYR